VIKRLPPVHAIQLLDGVIKLPEWFGASGHPILVELFHFSLDQLEMRIMLSKQLDDAGAVIAEIHQRLALGHEGVEYAHFFSRNTAMFPRSSAASSLAVADALRSTASSARTFSISASMRGTASSLNSALAS